MIETNLLGHTFCGNNEDGQFAQIRFKDSKFARVLREYSERSETIVEIGTWRGHGSTYCIWKGMVRPFQRLISLDTTRHNIEEARSLYTDPRIEFLWGHISEACDMPEFDGFSENQKKSYDHERNFVIASPNPNVLNQIPQRVDLCLMDGGNWNGDGDFIKLHDRCRWIALDDTNEKFQRKNNNLRQRMIDSGWVVLHDDLSDREGTFLAENANLKT